VNIDGKTGVVAQTKVDPPYAGIPPGSRVVSELVTAEFPFFEAHAQYFVAKLRAP
jgi:hypothetical protein